MHYVKQFNINGVDTRQVACITSKGRPNAATEGCVGVLCIDIASPTYDVYKCVAKEGSIHTWELLSSGMSIISATMSGGGTTSVDFAYANLRTPYMYVIKVGDLIIDSEGFLYQVSSISSTYCVATYCGVNFVASTHKHSADGILGGTFGGQVVANANGQDPSISLLRNSKILPSTSTEEPTVTGEIYWYYK